MLKLLNCNLFKQLPLLTLLFFVVSIKGESSIESLIENLSYMKQDSNYVDSLNELTFLYIRKDLKKAEENAINACKLSKELNYLRGIGDCETRFGSIYKLKGEFSTAFIHFDAALAIRKKLQDKEIIASTYNNIARCHLAQQNFSEAFRNCRMGLAILSNKSENKIKAHLYNTLSDINLFRENYKDAIIFLDSSFQIWNHLEDKRGMARTLNTQANIYFDFENWEASESNYKKSLRLYENLNDATGIAMSLVGLGNLYFYTQKKGLAFNHYKQALSFKKSLGIEDIAYIYYNIGTIQKEQENYDQAKNYYQKAHDIFFDLDLSWDLASINYDIGNLYLAKLDFDEAEKYYLKSFSYFYDDFDPYMKIQAANNLSIVYSKKNENELSLKYLQIHNNLRDSIYSSRIDAANLQSNLEKEKKEKAQLEAENLEKAKTNQRNNFLIMLLLAGIIILASMFALYRNHQKRQLAEFQTEQALLEADKAHLETQQAQLETNKAYMEIDNLLQNQEVVIAQARLDEKDTTYKQIGKDLHDGLGVMLSTIKLYFDGFSEQLKGMKKENEEKREKTFELLDEAVKEVRRISHQMQSGTLKKFGLAEAVKQLGTTINDSGQLSAKVYTHGFKEEKADNIDFKLYKIIQELVGNALKHAKAKQLTINLIKQEDNLNIIVEDDGIGFDTTKIGEKDGIGLKNITYRVIELGGTCHFDSVKGRGTNVIIDIPLKSYA